jgi:hypothetical protein
MAATLHLATIAQAVSTAHRRAGSRPERFFRMSRSSLRIQFSRRSRSFSWASPKSPFDTTSVSRCEAIHLFSDDITTPKSSATCLRVSPLVSAIRTASLRNPSVRFSPIVSLLCYSKCYQRSGIKPRQVPACCCRLEQGPGEWLYQSRQTDTPTDTGARVHRPFIAWQVNAFIHREGEADISHRCGCIRAHKP